MAGLPSDETVSMAALAEALVREASPAGAALGLDEIATAMALSFAATKILFRVSASPELALQAVGIMNESASKSMADMIAGVDAPNQRMQ